MRTDILLAALFTPLSRGRWGLPILMEGEPGVAKSSLIEDIAARLDKGTPGGFPCEVLSPGERGEAAFGCVPLPIQVGGKTVLDYPAPSWTSRFFESKRGLVFCDEVTTAPPLIQAPMLGLIGARRIGSITLPDGTRVIGACNPPEQAAYGHDLSPPLANRFGWIQWANPTVREHTDWMISQASNREDAPINAVEKEASVMLAWPEAYARAVGLETSFLTQFQDWKNRCPKTGDPKAGRAWPSDRSWTYATRALASSYVHGLSESSRDDFVTAFVGHAAYQQFMAFIEHADIPNPSDVLDGKVKFKHDKRRLDRTAAILNSCTALVTGEKDQEKQKERATSLWGILGTVGDDAMDLIVPPTEALVAAQMHRLKASVPVLLKINPVILATQDQ